MRLHEDNIKAELYRQLRNNNVAVVVEYSIPIRGDKVRKKVIPDLLVFNPNTLRPILIVEVKNTKRLNTNTKQIKRYKKLRIPILVINNYYSVNNAVTEIVKRYPDSVDSKNRDLYGLVSKYGIKLV